MLSTALSCISLTLEGENPHLFRNSQLLSYFVLLAVSNFPTAWLINIWNHSSQSNMRNFLIKGFIIYFSFVILTLIQPNFLEGFSGVLYHIELIFFSFSFTASVSMYSVSFFMFEWAVPLK